MERNLVNSRIRNTGKKLSRYKIIIILSTEKYMKNVMNGKIS